MWNDMQQRNPATPSTGEVVFSVAGRTPWKLSIMQAYGGNGSVIMYLAESSNIVLLSPNSFILFHLFMMFSEGDFRSSAS